MVTYTAVSGLDRFMSGIVQPDLAFMCWWNLLVNNSGHLRIAFVEMASCAFVKMNISLKYNSNVLPHSHNMELNCIFES